MMLERGSSPKNASFSGLMAKKTVGLHTDKNKSQNRQRFRDFSEIIEI